MSSEERAREGLGQIVENADQIAQYIEGIGIEEFRGEDMRRDAIERCLERIIEACVRIGQERLDRIAPGLLLHQVHGFGNRLRHEYDRINPEIVWRTATETIPALREACAKVLVEHRAVTSKEGDSNDPSGTSNHSSSRRRKSRSGELDLRDAANREEL